MNKVILMGRLTRDPDVRYTQGAEPLAVARYTLAVDRRMRKDSEGRTADFISCIAFKKNAEFAEKYLHQGIRIVIAGHIQTGSYVNRDGQKVYTADVVIDEQEFAESKASSLRNGSYMPDEAQGPIPQQDSEEFMKLPDGDTEELPFD